MFIKEDDTIETIINRLSENNENKDLLGEMFYHNNNDDNILY